MKPKKVFDPIRKISIDEEAHIVMSNYNEGKAAGRKEVVDWIEANKFNIYKDDFNANWQAKLKEWGLTEGES